MHTIFSRSSLLCHESFADMASWVPLPRQNAVKWILQVCEFYGFRPATAFVAVNYLDRFLSSNAMPRQNGEISEWPVQLLSVACVSVAAKMEETQVPGLMYLQILDPKFIFEPKTVTRMELLLTSALKWQMRSATPFDFVHRFGDLIKPKLIVDLHVRLISRATDLIMKTCHVVDILKYQPSEIAAAAIIHAVKEMADISDEDCSDLLRCFNEGVNEHNVREGIKLMEDTVIPASGSNENEQRKKPCLSDEFLCTESISMLEDD